MTIKEIAIKAGVSVASVSNVINGNYHKVSADTRSKIEKIIEESGYHPNAAARSLATQKSRIISLVIPHIGEYFSFSSNPYYAELIGEVEKYLRGKNYFLMLRCLDDYRDILPTLSSWNVDGALFEGLSSEEIREIHGKLECPVVYLDSYCDDKEVACVGINDYRGGYLAAQQLLKSGHRQIAFAGPKIGEEGVIFERFRGFCDACREYGVTLGGEDIFEVDSIVNNSIAAAQDIAFSPKKHTAVAVMSDVSARGIIAGLIQCGQMVPEDISVIGFDNLSVNNLSIPGLSTVSQNIPLKVKRACDMLFDMIQNGHRITGQEMIPTELVIRETIRNI